VAAGGLRGDGGDEEVAEEEAQAAAPLDGRSGGGVERPRLASRRPLAAWPRARGRERERRRRRRTAPLASRRPERVGGRRGRGLRAPSLCLAPLPSLGPSHSVSPQARARRRWPRGRGRAGGGGPSCRREAIPCAAGGRAGDRSGGSSSGARAAGLGRRRRALPWPLDGPIQRPFFFQRRGALPAQGIDPGFDS